jgi:hypothetical protein
MRAPMLQSTFSSSNSSIAAWKSGGVEETVTEVEDHSVMRLCVALRVFRQSREQRRVTLEVHSLS